MECAAVCVKFNQLTDRPYSLEVWLQQLQDGTWVKQLAQVVKKELSKKYHGDHYSQHGSINTLFPMERPVFDPNYVEGDHLRHFHFMMPNQEEGYGNHPVYMLNTRKVRTFDHSDDGPNLVCGADYGLYPLFCGECEGEDDFDVIEGEFREVAVPEIEWLEKKGITQVPLLAPGNPIYRPETLKVIKFDTKVIKEPKWRNTPSYARR